MKKYISVACAIRNNEHLTKIKMKKIIILMLTILIGMNVTYAGTLQEVGGLLRFEGINICLENGTGNYQQVKVVSSFSQLQTTINSCSGNDCHIQLTCGEFTATGKIDLESNMTLTGQGECSVIKLQSGFADITNLFEAQNKENIEISNFVIDGNTANFAYDRTIKLGLFNQTENINIHNMVLRNHRFNSTTGSKKGFEIWEGNNINVNHNAFFDMSEPIVIRNSEVGSITNNIGKTIYSRFIEVSDDWTNPTNTFSKYFVIDGNSVDTVYALDSTNGDAYYGKSENTVWSNNFANNVYRYGMRIIQSNSSYQQKNNKIIGNTIIMNSSSPDGNHGIIIYRQDKISVLGNTVQGSVKDCINAERNNNSIISNNMLIGCGNWGIQVQNSETRSSLISNNYIQDAGNTTFYGGISSTFGDKIKITNNQIKDSVGNTYYGIYSYDTTNWAVQNNHIQSIYSDPIYVVHGDEPLVTSGNIVFDGSDVLQTSDFTVEGDITTNGDFHLSGGNIIDDTSTSGTITLSGTNTGRLIRFVMGSGSGNIESNNDLYIKPGSVTRLMLDAASNVVQIGDGVSQSSVSMKSPDATTWTCGPDNTGNFVCS